MTFCTSCFCYFLSCICTTCDPLCVLLAQVDMYAGALFIQLALQWDIYLAVVLLLSVTALYTVAGDLSPSVSILNTSCLEILRSYCLLLVSLSCLRWSGCSYLHRCCTNCYHAGRISYPHGLQWVKSGCTWHTHTSPALCSPVCLTTPVPPPRWGFVEVGGWNALMEGYGKAIPSVRVPNSTCGIPRHDSFHIFRDPVNSDLPWPGVIIGMSIPSMWYWCSDQVL